MTVLTRTAHGWRGPQHAIDALQSLPAEQLAAIDAIPRGWSLRFLADGAIVIEDPSEREFADAAIAAWLDRVMD